MENKQIVEKMWRESLRGKLFTQEVCNVCQHSTPNTCDCAREKFIKTLTEEQISKFIELQKPKNRQQLWQTECEKLQKYNGRAPCVDCKGVNKFTCECAKKRFLD